jgi:hypothetical protein
LVQVPEDFDANRVVDAAGPDRVPAGLGDQIGNGRTGGIVVGRVSGSKADTSAVWIA